MRFFKAWLLYSFEEKVRREGSAWRVIRRRIRGSTSFRPTSYLQLPRHPPTSSNKMRSPQKDPYSSIRGRTVLPLASHPSPELGPNFTISISHVTYSPGTSFPPHIHLHTTYSTVLSGQITIAVDPPSASSLSEEKVYRKGESWCEPAGFVHRVTRNDGGEDAVWIVYSVIEKGKTAFELVDGEGKVGNGKGKL